MSFVKFVDAHKDQLSPVISEADFVQLLSQNGQSLNMSYEMYKDQQAIKDILLLMHALNHEVDCLHSRIDEIESILEDEEC